MRAVWEAPTGRKIAGTGRRATGFGDGGGSAGAAAGAFGGATGDSISAPPASRHRSTSWTTAAITLSSPVSVAGE